MRNQENKEHILLILPESFFNTYIKFCLFGLFCLARLLSEIGLNFIDTILMSFKLYIKVT